jgi:hypothetical protein
VNYDGEMLFRMQVIRWTLQRRGKLRQSYIEQKLDFNAWTKLRRRLWLSMHISCVGVKSKMLFSALREERTSEKWNNGN